MTRQVKAAILVQQHQPLVIDEVQLPEQLHYGQVLTQIYYSGVCGSQIGEIDGVKGEDKFLPHLLGHEGSGIVIETGPGVKRVQPGDHVVLHWKKGQGMESEVPIYSWKGQPLNAGWITTFNDHAIVSENRLTVIPKDFDLETAALLGCAITTGYGVVNYNAQLKIGESIIVYGAGGVGLAIIQGAALASAYPIVAIDRFDHKLELAKVFGATHTFHSEIMNLETHLLDVVGAKGADVVVDNTGNTGIIERAYALTHPQGRTILVGVPRVGQPISIYSLPLHFGKVLTGSYGGETHPSEDIPRYIRLIQGRQLNMKAMITQRYSLEHINEAIDQMRQGHVTGRCMIEFK